MNGKNEEDNQKMADAIKIVLIGNSGVGKTCISQKYINENETISDRQECTVGASYFQKFLDIDDKSLQLDIWDTAGQEKYRSMGKMFYKDAFIVLLIYDITDPQSFIDLKNVWYKELKDQGEKETILAVVGNKSDLFINEGVNENEARNWANEIGAIFALVSAKTGDCIKLLFESAVRKYLNPKFVTTINEEKKIKGEKESIKISVDTHQKFKKKKKCSC